MGRAGSGVHGGAPLGASSGKRFVVVQLKRALQGSLAELPCNLATCNLHLQHSQAGTQALGIPPVPLCSQPAARLGPATISTKRIPAAKRQWLNMYLNASLNYHYTAASDPHAETTVPTPGTRTCRRDKCGFCSTDPLGGAYPILGNYLQVLVHG